jgi:hypothetical protein
MQTCGTHCEPIARRAKHGTAFGVHYVLGHLQRMRVDELSWHFVYLPLVFWVKGRILAEANLRVRPNLGKRQLLLPSTSLVSCTSPALTRPCA